MYIYIHSIIHACNGRIYDHSHSQYIYIYICVYIYIGNSYLRGMPMFGVTPKKVESSDPDKILSE